MAAWIKVLKSKGFTINHIKTSAKVSLQDGWLSGFCDSEGCFNVNITLRKAMRVGYRVQLRFIIDQNDQTVLLLIKSLFGLGSVRYRKETERCYRYEASAFTRLQPVEYYFKAYPLRTFKKESLMRWSEIRAMMLNKDHTRPKGFAKIKNISKTSKR